MKCLTYQWRLMNCPYKGTPKPSVRLRRVISAEAGIQTVGGGFRRVPPTLLAERGLVVTGMRGEALGCMMTCVEA